MEFRSKDVDFSVSWLLGLKPYKFIAHCPKWARQFQTEDPSFSVSWLLGIRPAPRRLRRGGKRQAWRRHLNQNKDEDVGEASDGSETEDQEQSEQDEEEEDYGLRRMFGELDVDDEVEETNNEGDQAADSNSADQPSADLAVLAEPAFLELCSEMEEMLDSIEYVSFLFCSLIPILMWYAGSPRRATAMTMMNPSTAYHLKIAKMSLLPGWSGCARRRSSLRKTNISTGSCLFLGWMRSRECS